MNKELTKEQAINVLEQVTAMVKLTREEHQLVINAIRTLANPAPSIPVTEVAPTTTETQTTVN
jgi:hypothetical protein